MGGGNWSDDLYSTRNQARQASGKSAFDYSDTLKSASVDQWKVHDNLNPFGVKMRESRDSDEHPNSLAVGVVFDQTGSMGLIPRTLQENMTKLLGVILRKGYAENPQILFGAIGDAGMGERAPLQMGQFESDNRMDENLGNLFLEGMGGGNMRESYQLALYFMDRHTDIDCWNKRRQKGYLFLIGDELTYDSIDKDEVKRLIGDDLEADIPTAKVIARLSERYHVFFLMAPADNYGQYDAILKNWRKLLGERALELKDPEAVCETIALQIGLYEGVIDLDEGIGHLKEMGVDDHLIASATKSVVPLAASQAVAKATGTLPGLSGGTSGSKRL